MTKEEARQLKPGDRVLVEMTIRDRGNGNPPFNEEVGTVSTIVTWIDGNPIYDACYYSDIREKIAPPRRKFKDGDIVLSRPIGVIHFVVSDEEDGKDVKINAIAGSDCSYHCEANELRLLCAVEDRADRKEDA